MRFATLAAALILVAAATAPAQVRDGDLVAVCGDSITEQHYYSVYIEDYLLMCRPVANVRAEQFGWSGETSWGFHDKMAVFTLPYKPTVATTCYGMNDGGYKAIDDATARHYRDSQVAILDSFKAAGVHFVVLGSPGAVDTYTFRNHDQKWAATYNQTLAALGEIDRQIAKDRGVGFADVHGAMIDAMAKAKAKNGKTYAFAGADGVHPGPNGHLVMAYAFLKAMGFDGNIGTITVDPSAGTASGTDGHAVSGIDHGVVSVQSTRYPFCFAKDGNGDLPPAEVAEFVPFNQDLNRFMLVVNNPGADRAKVTFGPAAKEFSAADLAKGINLAAEFPDNPFSKSFEEVTKKLRTKQGQETAADKNFTMNLGYYRQNFPEANPAYDKIQDDVADMFKAQADAAATLVKPVKYTITIAPVK